MSTGFLRKAMPVLALVVPAMLAGCSASNDLNQTAAIASPPLATGVAAPGGTAPAATASDGQVVVNAQGAPVATTAVQAVPVAMADCDQLKAELAAFKTDKTAEKLAQFGQSKYTPTPDESTRFARYVAVNQANKEKCGTVASAPVVRKKVVKAATVKKAAAPVMEEAAGKVEKAAAVAKPADKVKKIVKVVKTKVDAAVDPLMDPTNQTVEPLPADGVMTTGSSG